MKSDDREKVANITPFGLRLQPELKRRVEEAARANARSLNSEIAARLERSFDSECVPDFITPDLLARVAAVEKQVFEIIEFLGMKKPGS